MTKKEKIREAIKELERISGIESRGRKALIEKFGLEIYIAANLRIMHQD